MIGSALWESSNPSDQIRHTESWDSGYRTLSYLDEDDEIPFKNETLSENTEVIWLFVLAVGFCLIGILNIRVTKASQTFYEWNAIRLILPGIQFVMVFDCVTLAADRMLEDEGIARQWAISIYMLSATVAPGIFLSTFVITFLAYRNRSIPFCMVQRAPGRNTTHLTGNMAASMTDDLETGDGTEGLQPLIRPATMVAMMRLFSCFCFLLSMIVNFDVVWNAPDLAGRTGWATIVTEPWDEDGENWHVFLSLTPIALVSICCFYFAVLLWRYGSFFSMKIYASIFNPWFSPVFGTLCMIVGQCFGPDLFPVMSRTGIWLYQLCLLHVIFEVRHDLQQSGDLGHFLDALGDDHITGSTNGGDATVSEKTSTRGGFSHQLSRELQSLPSLN